MKLIKYKNALKGKNSDKCKLLEYLFMDKDIDLGIAIIIKEKENIVQVHYSIVK